MPSRDPNDLHPELKARWEYMRDEWKRTRPWDPQPFLTCTYRAASEQAKLVEEGKSYAGPMRSLHNFVPALAFDVAFLHPDGAVTWEFRWYQAWGELAESLGLEWGGRWKGLVDGVHVQWPTTWQVAQAGNLPDLPPLPDDPEGELLPVKSLFVHYPSGRVERVELDSERPARVVGWKLMVNVRE